MGPAAGDVRLEAGSRRPDAALVTPFVASWCVRPSSMVLMQVTAEPCQCVDVRWTSVGRVLGFVQSQHWSRYAAPISPVGRGSAR